MDGYSRRGCSENVLDLSISRHVYRQRKEAGKRSSQSNSSLCIFNDVEERDTRHEQGTGEERRQHLDDCKDPIIVVQDRVPEVFRVRFCLLLPRDLAEFSLERGMLTWMCLPRI